MGGWGRLSRFSVTYFVSGWPLKASRGDRRLEGGGRFLVQMQEVLVAVFGTVSMNANGGSSTPTKALRGDRIWVVL